MSISHPVSLFSLEAQSKTSLKIHKTAMGWALSGVSGGIVGGVVVVLVVISVLAFRRSHVVHQPVTLTRAILPAMTVPRDYFRVAIAPDASGGKEMKICVPSQYPEAGKFVHFTVPPGHQGLVDVPLPSRSRIENAPHDPTATDIPPTVG